MTIGVRAPPTSGQDIGASPGPHNLEANTVSDPAVENKSQRVKNDRLFGGYPKQFQFFEHLRDFVYKWTDLLGKLSRNLLKFRDDCVYPIICLMLEKDSSPCREFRTFPV